MNKYALAQRKQQKNLLKEEFKILIHQFSLENNCTHMSYTNDNLLEIPYFLSFTEEEIFQFLNSHYSTIYVEQREFKKETSCFLRDSQKSEASRQCFSRSKERKWAWKLVELARNTNKLHASTALLCGF